MTTTTEHDAPTGGPDPAPGPEETCGPVGPRWGDGQLAAWRRAATSGDLPTPGRERWQVLRAGVVNLWEYDVAEYWFADGRAQLTGGNQSGKSTLMALTTLILLSGDLDRRNVDTFGKGAKAYRYYVEPSGDDTDRRETNTDTNRSWAWVEYGRQTPTGPQYYTTALYAQAKRGVAQLHHEWVVASGPRVRADLRLVTGQAVAEAKALRAVPGVEVYTSGKAYADRQGKDLFRFTRADRMDTLVAMLRVLRLPHLGQQLNPEFFTEQMRLALPAVDQVEIDQLADGWDQLDRLAEDRDTAKSAQQALTTFVTSAYNPWADAVLRSRADALTTAVTVFDDVTRTVTTAQADLDRAQAQQDALTDELVRLNADLVTATTRRETLAESAEAKAAQDITRQIERLTGDVKSLQRDLREQDVALAKAGERVEAVRARLTRAQNNLDRAKETVTSRAGALTDLLTGAGLPQAAAGWVLVGAADRIATAVATRQGHLGTVRGLITTAERIAEQHERATTSATEASDRVRRSSVVAQDAQTQWTSAGQGLADTLERWATDLAPAIDAAAALVPAITPGTGPGTGSGPWPAAPTPALRSAWLEAVLTQAAAGEIVSTLGQRVSNEWLNPALEPIRGAAAAATQAARAARDEAAALEAEADRAQEQTEPEPVAPTGWARRTRPGAGPGGAPLWRLLDPRPEHTDHLDTLEAALAAAGVLDAWVTPDGAWVEGRDGDDTVLTPWASSSTPAGSSDPAGGGTGPAAGPAAGPADPGASRTLADLCAVASDAGPLHAAALAAARMVTVVAHGQRLRPQSSNQDSNQDSNQVGVTVSLDGRWASANAAGRAASLPGGASLLGAAAREAARVRRVAELRERAAASRAVAATQSALADDARNALEALTAAAATAPNDTDVLAAAAHVREADKQLAADTVAQAKAVNELTAAETASAQANTMLLEFATAHDVPNETTAVNAVTETLQSIQRALTPFTAALTDTQARERELADLLTQEADVVEQHQEAAAARGRADADLGAAGTALTAATEALNSDARSILEQVQASKDAVVELDRRLATAREREKGLVRAVTQAEGKLDQAATSRAEAELGRTKALTAWLVPIRAGLAVARALPELGEENLTRAVELARTARTAITPRAWPDSPDDRVTLVARAWLKVTSQVSETRSLLEAAGGRTLTIVIPSDETSTSPASTGQTGASPVSERLPYVTVTVDSGGEPVTPWAAAVRLGGQVAELTESHDSKLSEVLTELLSSTFVNHLRSRTVAVVDLLTKINAVLSAHPTGASSTVLRLHRQASPGKRAAYDIVNTLAGGFLDDPAVQSTIRDFLHEQVQEAQELGRADGSDWKDHLRVLLDYRRWFDVVTHTRSRTAHGVP